MEREQEFAAILEAVKKQAREQGNCILQEQLQEAFAPLDFDEKQLQMVVDYLKTQKIGIGEPADLDDYLSEEETDYLNTYLESLNLMEAVSEGEREAITLSAMAGDGTAKRALIELTLPQVVDVAKLYAGQGVFLEDLIGEGNLALSMAVEMLETAENAAQAQGLLGSMIMEAMENHIAENVREKEAGNKIADKVNRVADQAKQLAQELGRKVTVRELAGEEELSLYDIIEAIRLSGDAIEDLDTTGWNREGIKGQ